MGLFSFGERARRERRGFELYGRCVRAARSPFYFAELAVPDTLDGRFDLVALFAALLIRRLNQAGAEGAALSQAVFDAMFSDMDINLREMGVADLSVGKRVRAMWEAFHGRALAYGAALDRGEGPALEAALHRNVWRGSAPDGAAARLAALAMSQAAHLETQPIERLREGEVSFLPAPELTA